MEEKKYNNLGEIKKVVTSQKEARTSTTNSQLPMSLPETTASDDPLSFRSPNGEVEDSPLSDSTSFHPLQTLTPTAINDALQTPFGIGTTNGVVDLDDPLLAVQTSIPKLSLPYSFIDPPSYEDVVFSPTQTDCNDRHSSSSLFHQIVVSDPQKEDGMSYFTYLIKSKVATDGNEIMVRRRFRDVVLLADRLSEAYRGYFVPSRPDKSVVDSQVMQTHDFVEQRRVAIEKYLKRLAEHPVIGKSDEFKLFMETRSSFSLAVSNELEGVGRLPVLEQHLFGEDSGMGSSEESGQSARGGRDLMKLFRELKQSVVNDWGRVKPAVVEDDNELLVWKEKVQEFEQPLSNASQQAESLVKTQQDVAETMGDLGMMFMKLSRFETENTMHDTQKIRAAYVKGLGTSAVKASRFYRELNGQSMKHLETLHEYLGLILSIHTALSDRSSALLTVQTLISDLSSLHAKAGKLESGSSGIFSPDKARVRKIEEMKETIRMTEDAKNVAYSDYERIKENNRHEFKRFDKERRRDFSGMLKAFVINQVGYAEKIASVWEEAVEDTSVYSKNE